MPAQIPTPSSAPTPKSGGSSTPQPQSGAGNAPTPKPGASAGGKKPDDPKKSENKKEPKKKSNKEELNKQLEEMLTQLFKMMLSGQGGGGPGQGQGQEQGQDDPGIESRARAMAKAMTSQNKEDKEEESPESSLSIKIGEVVKDIDELKNEESDFGQKMAMDELSSTLKDIKGNIEKGQEDPNDKNNQKDFLSNMQKLGGNDALKGSESLNKLGSQIENHADKSIAQGNLPKLNMPVGGGAGGGGGGGGK